MRYSGSKARRIARNAACALAALLAADLGFTPATAADSLPPADVAAPTHSHVSCIGAPNEVLVTVRGVANSVGLMRADLYRNDPAGFLNVEGRVKKVSFAAAAPETTFCIHAPEAGEFAIAVYHDENANLKFDKKAFGLPAEPYGISNDPVIRFAPPTVEEALFTVEPDGTAIVITLKG